ncbi:MAG: DUF4832 domain-containing protein [Archangium sp.]
MRTPLFLAFVTLAGCGGELTITNSTDAGGATGGGSATGGGDATGGGATGGGATGGGATGGGATGGGATGGGGTGGGNATGGGAVGGGSATGGGATGGGATGGGATGGGATGGGATGGGATGGGAVGGGAVGGGGATGGGATGGGSATGGGGGGGVMTTRVCAVVNEWDPYPTPGTLSVSCPAGQVIQSISFASYGTPAGTCGAFAADATCHATSSVTVLQSLCVGHASCSATDLTTVFGDPCAGTSKRLHAQFECGAPVTDAGVADAGTPVIDAGSNNNPSAALNFSEIPLTAPDLVAPGRALEIWNAEDQAIAYPTDGSGLQATDVYHRFTWAQLETARDVYNWALFDYEIRAAIDQRRKFAFAVMTVCPGCGSLNLNYGGAESAYPAYLHSDMQAESVRDWISPIGGGWIPNWNSNAYLSRFERLLVKINEHLENTTWNGVLLANAINYIDIRGYGSWGEWHQGGIVDDVNGSQQPQAARATSVTLNRIIDAHVNGFPNQQLVAMISTFDANRLQNTMNPPDVALHALQTQNARGKLGWRRDNWGCLDNRCGDYLRYYSDLHPDPTLRALIMERYKFAPINGEPMNGGSVVGDASGSTCYYFELKTQVERYHAASFGNGNFQSVTNAQCARDNVRAAAKASGYRLLLTGGSMTTNVGSTRRLTVRLDWRNVGVAPTYEDWNVTYELRNSAGTTVWSGSSSMVLRLFLPAANSNSVTDTFTLPSTIAAGTYSVRLVVKDPNGFRRPLPLAVLGRDTDGSYLLNTLVVP